MNNYVITTGSESCHATINHEIKINLNLGEGRIESIQCYRKNARISEIHKHLESQQNKFFIGLFVCFNRVKEGQVETSKIFSGAVGQARRNNHWGMIQGSPYVELIPRRS